MAWALGSSIWLMYALRLYLQEDLSRLPICTLPIHYLLHIANGIRKSGPVWCSWAFPMERFCGSLLPAVTSRKHPYRSIDRRITELAQLCQIKNLYDLHDTLDLRSHNTIEQSGKHIDGCGSLIFDTLLSFSSSNLLAQMTMWSSHILDGF